MPGDVEFSGHAQANASSFTHHSPNTRYWTSSSHPCRGNATKQSPENGAKRRIAEAQTIGSRAQHAESDIVGSQINRDPEQKRLQVRNPGQLGHPLILWHAFDTASLEVVLDQLLLESLDIGGQARRRTRRPIDIFFAIVHGTRGIIT